MNKILVVANGESDLLTLMKENNLDITVISSEISTRPLASAFDALCILGGTESSALIPSAPCHDLLDAMRKAGKPVFCEMCARHRNGGADFMSLYTGEDNPARNIYESAGFRIVRSFADMRKAVKK